MIVRLLAPDYKTKKQERKEWLYYREDWEAKNSLGIAINRIVSEYIEGKHTELLTKPVFDPTTGIYTDNAWVATRVVYTMPNSKKAVDDIIAKRA